MAATREDWIWMVTQMEKRIAEKYGKPMPTEEEINKKVEELWKRRFAESTRGQSKAIALGAQATAEEALALTPRQAIAIAQAAEASVNDLSNAVGQNTSKIATLWDAVFSEITTNPFQITFADLTGITLTAGIWNSGLQRLEC